jgi:hypothetical protein
MRSAWVVGTSLALFSVATPAWAKTKSHLATYAPSDTTITSFDATVTLPSFTCKSSKDAVTNQIAFLNNDSGHFSGSNVNLVCTKEKVGKHHILAPQYSVFLDVDGAITFPSVIMNAGDTVVLSTS